MDQLMNFLISNAYAQTNATAAQGGGYSFLIMFVVFFIFIYFVIWRPQNKRAKEQQTMLGSLTKGDEVITAGGLLGKITKMNGPYIVLTIADETDIVMQKSSVVSVLPKGTLKTLD